MRLPMRVGKAVTQEEVAEAVGVSRQWYGLIESDRAVHFSAAVLARIADALMMDPAERDSLFRLALPELRSAVLADRSTPMLDAFESMRRLMRRLWAASTEEEALMVVRDYAMTQLAPNVMMTCTRVEEGLWDHVTTGDAADADRTKQILALVRERWGPTAIEDMHCYTLLAQPGDLMTRPEWNARFPDLAAKLRPELEAIDRSDFSFVMAHIRSQRGLVARLYAIHRTAHAYSEVERAQLSALADFTSLALSGCVSSSRRNV